VRYKPGQRISDNFYVRQDGTRAYYFTVDELSQLWSSCGCDVIECKMCTVINKNRKKKLDMKRVFAQGRFVRSWPQATTSTSLIPSSASVEDPSESGI
jgi:methyltransferase-like protein 6